ncbi:26S proteasome regulatory subunit S2 [Cavenderia fasciculata]|uniref:26S proteasome regulatory subunit S2 n=1 Tax=Cavenderia fasciculata TaxID=261658 RepID=F4Q5A0_CACFS|nr:26S proteasome regulatory subunit S2 [Cavenderia fasciculata]EGG17159.1 26S proteasome regulatory subunit S2 [Cavenderia fasciculata]|eukprot:XP_004355643.1 26S proteasome regulatory subunit S2 [Cavenderia fasciculata]
MPAENNNNNNAATAAKPADPVKKEPAKKKDEKKEDALSAEDEKLKGDLEMLVERVKDSNQELALAALESLKTEIKSSTSSMTSVPKPLKFLGPHYNNLTELYKTFDEGKKKKSLADVLSVLAMANSKDDARDTLKFRLLGSGESISSWGHEYVRHLATEIGQEYQLKSEETQSVDDLLQLVDEIIPFQMNHNAEPDACDLLFEVEQLPKILGFVDDTNYLRVALYLTSFANYVPGPDDVNILKIVIDIYLKAKQYPDALRIALKISDNTLINHIFTLTEKDLPMLQQLAFISARQKVLPTEFDVTPVANIINNARLSEFFLNLATDLDVREPKLPEDIFQSHLDSTGSTVPESARINLATGFVNAFVNCGFLTDRLMSDPDKHWVFKNRDLGILSTVASLGMINLWDVDNGLSKLDTYLYKTDEFIKSGAILGIGMLSSGVRSEMDPVFAMNSEHITNPNSNIRICTILSLGIAYAGTKREDISSMITSIVDDSSVGMDLVGISALALGMIFIGSCNDDLSTLFVQTLMTRDKTSLSSTFCRFLSLGLGLLYLGKQDEAELTLETLKAIEGAPGEYARLTVESCAFAGTGNVLKVQNMLHFCSDGKENPNHSLAVLSIALIAMGEELGGEMCLRTFDHLLQKGNVHIKRAIPMALGLLSASNPRIAVMDILSKLSHDQDVEVSQGAILALGLIGAGTNNARVGALLKALAVFYAKETHLFFVRMAQGLLHLGKGTLTINPYHSDRSLLSPVALSGLLVLLHAGLDIKNLLFTKAHYLFYSIVCSIYPRMLMTLDENLNPLPVSVRVGQSVDTVGQAGKPKTITGFQTHTTPVLLGYNDRAELATDDYIPLSSVLEGIVILKPNPNASILSPTVTKALGCGCIGLSTGIILLKSGKVNNVSIWSRDLPPNTTSNKAAAVWYPFLSNPPDKVGRWSQETMDYFKLHIINDKKSGTLVKKVNEVFKRPKKEDPEWKPYIPSFRRIRQDELPKGYVDGYAIDDGFVMDTDMYMDYLVDTFKSLGGVIDQRTVVDIREPMVQANIVINCTGLGSRELIGDRTIYPARGQIIVIDKTTERSIFDEEDYIAYVIPRITNTVLGGTNQEHDYNTEINEKDTEEILDKVANISEEFHRKNIKILGVKVGLRPARDEIRLESEFHQDGRKLLVHNYGHGGSGFTVSWGCAVEVLKQLEHNIPKLKLDSLPIIQKSNELNSRV